MQLRFTRDGVAPHLELALAEAEDVAARAPVALADLGVTGERVEARLGAQQGEGGGLHQAADGAQLGAHGAIATRPLGQVELDLEPDVVTETAAVMLGDAHGRTFPSAATADCQELEARPGVSPARLTAWRR